MDTFEAIYTRRSIRNFQSGNRITKEVLGEILNSAWYAPLAPGGVFPWRLIVVRDKVTKDLFANCAKEIAKTMFGGRFETFGAGHLWYMDKDTRLAVAEYTTTGELWEYPRECDLLIVPVISKGSWIDAVVPFSESLEIVSSYLGFAAQNMWLAAHSHGIGAGYNAMPIEDIRRRELVSECLGIPPSWEVGGSFCFGYATSPRYFGPARSSLDNLVFSEYWGNPYRRIGFRGVKYEATRFPKVDVLESIRNLSVAKVFEDELIPDWVIEKIFDTAMWGPIGENIKLHRFILVRDRESKEFLRGLVTEKQHCPWFFNYPELEFSRLRHIPEQDRLEKIEEMHRTFGQWITEANAVIISLSANFNWLDSPYLGVAPGALPQFSIANACCIQNMALAATTLGLGFNFDMLAGGEGRSRELLREYFGIPADTWLPQAIIGVGKVKEKLSVPPKPPLDGHIFEEYWGRPYQSDRLP